jgi:hypothetical protein
MQSEILELVSVGRSSVLVGEHHAPVILNVLEHDADSPAYPDGLIESIRNGDPVDLMQSRSAAAAEHDGQTPTVAGYLMGLVRDRFSLGHVTDLREFVALGLLAADVEAIVGTAQ